MIKVILIGVWVSGLMTGSAYMFSNYMKSSSSSGSIELNQLTHIKLNSMSIAMIRNSKIIGYLILEPVVIVDNDLSEELSVPIEYYARDVIISTVHSNEDIDTYRLDKFDLVAFQKQVVSNLNKNIGKRIVRDVLIQNIDFITKEDVRDLQLRRS